MIYFLSDAHIGSRAMDDPRHQQRFVEMLDVLARDATAFYLLGDIFDFWSEYVWPDRSKERFAPVLDCLRSLTDCGIPVHFFIGNHDIWTYGKLAERTGVIVHRKPQVLTIAGKRCMLAHGDGLVPSGYVRQLPPEAQKKIRSFMRARRFFHNPVAQFFFRLLPPAWGNNFGYEWAKQSRLKELARPCGYKGENREELVLYAKELEQTGHLDYYIFGHRHIELDLELATGARVIILGDCISQWTYAMMTEDGHVSLMSLAET